MNMIVRTTHKELPVLLDLLSDIETEIESKVIEPEDFENGKIITYGALYVLEDLGISVIEGEYCNYAEKYYEPDFSISIIYDTTSLDDFDFNNYMYWEQAPPMTTIHNYLNSIKRSDNNASD